MPNKKRTGVLEYNTETRNEQLKRNNGKYSQYDGILTPAIGETYNIRTFTNNGSITDGMPLQDYTHGEENDYSEKNHEDYFSNKPDLEEYDDSNSVISNRLSWNGDFIDYRDYVYDTYGKESFWYSFAKGVLSSTDIVYAMQSIETGIVKNINVNSAINGVITTNPNNSNNTDTKLGAISNTMYSSMLLGGATFNDLRKRGTIINADENSSSYKKNGTYITPYLYESLGNNLYTITNLSDILRVDSTSGMVMEDIGGDIKIIHDQNDTNLGENSGLYFLGTQFNEANKYLEEENKTNFIYSQNNGYVEFTNGDTSAINSVIGETQTGETIGLQQSATTMNGSLKVGEKKRKHFVYADLDKELSSSSVNVTTEFNDYHNDEPYGYYEKGDSIEYGASEGEEILGLMGKTMKLFKERKIGTMLGRFCTGTGEHGLHSTTIDTAIDDVYGNSHGRNLMVLDVKKNPSKEANINGYKNPYCRTWTYHHEYEKVKNLIRPFISDDTDDNATPIKLEDIQYNSKRYRSMIKTDSLNEGGWTYLSRTSALQDNGFVKITPYSEDAGKKDNIKRCMLSIENLAWKDFTATNKYIGDSTQIGPHGGRIMWFPPYDLEFQENVNVNWDHQTFIGRGEDVYTYTNTNRSGQLSFSVLIDHPSIIDSTTNDGYLGEGQEQDADADVLRFFAGCNLFNPDSVKEEEEEKTEEVVTPPEETPQDKEEEKIIFYVYFPNNYSGNLKEYADKKVADSDMLEYLLAGRNTSHNGVDLDGGLEIQTDAMYNEGTTDALYNFESDTESHTTTLTLNFQPEDSVYKSPWTNNTENNGFGTDLIEQLYSCGAFGDASYGYTYSKYDTDNKTYIITPTDYFLNYSETSETYSKDTTTEDISEKFLNSMKDGETLSKYYSDLTELGYNEEQILFFIRYGLLPSYYHKVIDIGGNFEAETACDSNLCINLYDYIWLNLSGKTNDSRNLIFNNYAYSDIDDNPLKVTFYMKYLLAYEDIKSEVKENIEKSFDQELSTKTYSINGGTSRPVNLVLNIKYETNNYCLGYEMRDDKVNGISTPSSGDSLDDAIRMCNTEQDIGGTCKISWDSKDRTVLNSFFYRVDHDLRQNHLHQAKGTTEEKLKEANNSYSDNASFQLNYNEERVKEIEDYKDATTSFAKVFMALWSLNSVEKDLYNKLLTILKGFGYTDLDTEIENMAEKLMSKKITKVTVKGGATNQDTNNSATLAERRRDMVIICLKKYIEGTNGKVNISKKDAYTSEKNFTFSENLKFDPIINSKKAKAQRCARVEILLENNETTTSDSSTDESISQATVNLGGGNISGVSGNTITKIVNDDTKKADKSVNKAENIDTSSPSKYSDRSNAENEYEYFKYLDVNQPFIHKKLVDKFKYFDPAFHSITPEGFNARMTFLHQCTRQGHTCAASDTTIASRTAGNLSFGRMPVCVLRIGDYIYSRVIIESMSITYSDSGGMKWDLNPEGAGIQPMYAKINLNVSFIGGQSLDGPVNRLQNAQTFDYYANTGVYDNRSDRITIDNDGKLVYTHVFDVEKQEKK